MNRKSDMVQALITELILRKNEIKETVETIYIGGGTPSLLSKKEIQHLFNAIYDNYNVSDTPEITLEANPDDLSKGKIWELSNSPVNRLSLGVQSFFDEDLKMMNRAHTSAESRNSLAMATRYFENVTVDLIYGLPNMSVKKWKENLKQVFGFGVPHISSYALTVEKKTALENFIKKGKIPPLDESLAAEHFEILVNETSKNGFVQYEISNFGKPHFFSKHNSSYWQGKSYVGIGPSAHSFNGHQRSWNLANNAKYIRSIEKKILPQEIEDLNKKDQFNEYIMTGLRTIWGVSIETVEKKFGSSVSRDLLKNIEKHMKNGTLQMKSNAIMITEKGKFLADGIASDLFIV